MPAASRRLPRPPAPVREGTRRLSVACSLFVIVTREVPTVTPFVTHYRCRAMRPSGGRLMNITRRTSACIATFALGLAMTDADGAAQATHALVPADKVQWGPAPPQL